MGRRGCCVPVLPPSLAEFSLIGQLTVPAIPPHISKSSFVRSLGPGLVPSWADPDYGWESDVSGDAPF